MILILMSSLQVREREELLYYTSSTETRNNNRVIENAHVPVSLNQVPGVPNSRFTHPVSFYTNYHIPGTSSTVQQ